MKDDDRDFYERLGELIRGRRKKVKGMTQAKLAQVLDIPRTSVTMVEQGRQAVTVRQLVQIARALKVPYAELVPEFAAPKPKVPDAERAWLESVADEK